MTSTSASAPASPTRIRSTPAVTLARVITCFEPAFLARYQSQLLPSQLKALKAMQTCRSSLCAQMLAQCTSCGEQRLVPLVRGHRSCPHCQHFESQRWIERQTQALLPGTYFLITFTLPQELRDLAWSHQQTVFGLLMQCAWDTLAQFSRNHRQLKGSAGAVGVLHTHSRRLEFHPHVHLAMPGAALDAKHGLWRSLRKTKKGGYYLFNHKALAAVFRGKLLAALNAEGLTVPVCLPECWVVEKQERGQWRARSGLSGPLPVPGRDSGTRHPALRERSGHVPLSRQQHRQEHDTDRQRRALFVAGVATRLAQRVSALTQLWFAPSQLQAPPAVGAAGHGAQARRYGARPGGHAAIYTVIDAASIERTPQTAVPLLRRGDGDRASAYRTP